MRKLNSEPVMRSNDESAIESDQNHLTSKPHTIDKPSPNASRRTRNELLRNSQNPWSDFLKACTHTHLTLSESFKIAWMLWAEHRKERNAPLTPTTIRLQAEKLSQMNAQDATRTLIQSIENGWLGLFPLINNKTTETKQPHERKRFKLPSIQEFIPLKILNKDSLTETTTNP